MTLGTKLGLLLYIFWFDRNASNAPISTTKTVESFVIAIDLGCAAVGVTAGLHDYKTSVDGTLHSRNRRTYIKVPPEISLTLSSQPTE